MCGTEIRNTLSYMTSYIGIARTQSYMQTPGTMNRVNCLWCI